MPEQKVPSIGRVVHYRVASNDDDILRFNGAEVLPAVIVQVWGDDCVNLKVLCDGPQDAWKTSVLLGEEEGDWFWPPYVPPKVKEE